MMIFYIKLVAFSTVPFVKSLSSATTCLRAKLITKADGMFTVTAAGVHHVRPQAARRADSAIIRSVRRKMAARRQGIVLVGTPCREAQRSNCWMTEISQECICHSVKHTTHVAYKVYNMFIDSIPMTPCRGTVAGLPWHLGL